MIKKDISRDEFEEFKEKFNDLCDTLTSMEIKKVVDFDAFKVEEDVEDFEDEDNEEETNSDINL